MIETRTVLQRICKHEQIAWDERLASIDIHDDFAVVQGICKNCKLVMYKEYLDTNDMESFHEHHYNWSEPSSVKIEDGILTTIQKCEDCNNEFPITYQFKFVESAIERDDGNKEFEDKDDAVAVDNFINEKILEKIKEYDSITSCELTSITGLELKDVTDRLEKLALEDKIAFKHNGYCILGKVTI